MIEHKKSSGRKRIAGTPTSTTVRKDIVKAWQSTTLRRGEGGGLTVLDNTQVLSELERHVLRELWRITIFWNCVACGEHWVPGQNEP